MSYLVLARKYRPRNFSEMVGQEHVVQALANALTQQRLHHAYLFTGTRGVGKTTVSRILAKSLNCQGADGKGSITATPCGVCAACTEIDSGRFPDYTELDAASNRGVDEVQSLLEQAVYKPVQGRFKVFMIDEVHMLTNTAFNAMLKTLEEPPEYLKFVLATTDPQKVPVTVLSRCLQFNLRPMAPETVHEHLARVLAQENVPADAQALRLLARAARGSMRDALSLTDQAIAFGSGSLQEATVRQMLGSVDRGHVFRLIEALAGGDGRAVVEISEELRRNGLSAASTLEEMSAVLQRMAVLQAVPDMAQDASDPEAATIAELAHFMPADETQLLYSICLHGRNELGLAPDEYAALTMALLRLLAFKSPGSVGTAEKKTLRPRPVERPVVPAPVVAATPVAMAAPVAVAVDEPRLPEAALQASEVQPVAEIKASPPPVAQQVTAEPEPVEPLVSPVPTAPLESRPAVQEMPASAAADEVSEDGAGDEPGTSPDEGAWAGMPDQAWEDDARWRGSDDDGGYADAPPQMAQDLPQPRSVERGEPQILQPVDAAPEVQRTAEGDYWQGVVERLIASEAVTALARQLALQAQLVERTGPLWTLRVETASLNQNGARERLRAALQAEGLAEQLQVEQGAVTDSPARRNAVAAHARQRIAEQIVRGDPMVQTLVREHGAKIVPGSIRPISIAADRLPD